MRSKKPVPFAPYEPDKAISSGTARVAKGVISQSKRYAPLQGMALYYPSAGALNDFCLGAAGFYDENGQPSAFLGDRGRLYRLIGKAPVDVSANGGYAVDPDWAWSFDQFGNNIIAAGRGPRLQRFVLGESSAFTEIAGSPRADVVFRIRQHLWACSGRTANWSAFNNVLDWEPDFATQAGATDLGQEFGIITAGIGGEQGALFQERGITRVTYVGGNVPWSLDEVEGGRGAVGPNAVRRFRKGAFVVAEDGLYYWNGLDIEPIGEDKVDATFAADLNYPYRARITTAVDYAKKCWMVAYPAGNSAVPNKVLIFSWADARWTHDEFETQQLFELPREGVNADDQAGIEALFGTANADELTNVSVDSPAWRESRRAWAAVNSARKVVTFTDANRAASIETGEFEPNPARQTFMSELWPICDAPPGYLTASLYAKPYRLDEQATLADTGPMNELGCCEVQGEARFLKARFDIAAGAPWTEAVGTHYDGEASGEW